MFISQTSLKISVIVSAHNEEDVIADCLDALLKEKYPHKEIIVVNDGSTDNTRRIVENYGDKIKLINFEKEHSAAFARNAGSKVAEGKILIFIDADLIIALGFMEKVVEDFAKYNVKAMTINVLRGGRQDELLQKCYQEQWSWTLHNAIKVGVKMYTSPNAKLGNAYILDKELFKRMHGYDERIFYFEDGDLTDRILRLGEKMLFDPMVIAYHRDPSMLSQVFKQGMYLGLGKVRLFRLGKEYKERAVTWAWGSKSPFYSIVKPFFYPTAIFSILVSPLVPLLAVPFVAVLLSKFFRRLLKSKDLILSFFYEFIFVPIHRFGACYGVIRALWMK